jgi:hypothetical protein
MLRIMTVDINYWLVGLLFVVLAILITWFIKRDHKDEKKFEKEIIESELKPEGHPENNDSDLTP